MNVGNKVYHQPKLRPLSPGLSLITSLTGWAPVSTDSWAVSPDTWDTGLVTGHRLETGAGKWREDVWAESWLVTQSSYLGT